jgi:hypothetical protein
MRDIHRQSRRINVYRTIFLKSSNHGLSTKYFQIAIFIKSVSGVCIAAAWKMLNIIDRQLACARRYFDESIIFPFEDASLTDLLDGWLLVYCVHYSHLLWDSNLRLK